jgi:hypothetical protein
MFPHYMLIISHLFLLRWARCWVGCKLIGRWFEPLCRSYNSELKQVTFLTTRTAWVTSWSEDWVKGCDWWKTSTLLPVYVRVVKNVTCLNSLLYQIISLVNFRKHCVFLGCSFALFSLFNSDDYHDSLNEALNMHCFDEHPKWHFTVELA